MTAPTCALCHQPITAEDHRLYFQVVGWERARPQGGTNALRCRKRTGQVAHPFCVDRVARQIDPGQGSLL